MGAPNPATFIPAIAQSTGGHRLQTWKSLQFVQKHLMCATLRTHTIFAKIFRPKSTNILLDFKRGQQRLVEPN